MNRNDAEALKQWSQQAEWYREGWFRRRYRVRLREYNVCQPSPSRPPPLLMVAAQDETRGGATGAYGGDTAVEMFARYGFDVVYGDKWHLHWTFGAQYQSLRGDTAERLGKYMPQGSTCLLYTSPSPRD